MQNLNENIELFFRAFYVKPNMADNQTDLLRRIWLFIYVLSDTVTLYLSKSRIDLDTDYRF